MRDASQLSPLGAALLFGLCTMVFVPYGIHGIVNRHRIRREQLARMERLSRGPVIRTLWPVVRLFWYDAWRGTPGL
jgi:hypothetical protein